MIILCHGVSGEVKTLGIYPVIHEDVTLTNAANLNFCNVHQYHLITSQRWWALPEDCKNFPGMSVVNLVKSLNNRLKLLPSVRADVVRESLHFQFWVEVQMYVASKFMPEPLAYWIVPLLVWIIVLQVFIVIELLISWARPVQDTNSGNVYPPDLDSHGRLRARHFSPQCHMLRFPQRHHSSDHVDMSEYKYI